MWPGPPPHDNEGSTHSFQLMALSTLHLYLCNTRSARAWQYWK
jgi:hypothetical protein